jgi:hypothetical protein
MIVAVFTPQPSADFLPKSAKASYFRQGDRQDEYPEQQYQQEEFHSPKEQQL